MRAGSTRAERERSAALGGANAAAAETAAAATRSLATGNSEMSSTAMSLRDQAETLKSPVGRFALEEVPTARRPTPSTGRALALA